MHRHRPFAPKLTRAQVAAVAGVQERMLRSWHQERGFLRIGERLGWTWKFTVADAIRARVTALLGRFYELPDAAVAAEVVARLADQPPGPMSGERQVIIGFDANGGCHSFTNTLQGQAEFGHLLNRPYIVIPCDAIIADTMRRIQRVLDESPPMTVDKKTRARGRARAPRWSPPSPLRLPRWQPRPTMELTRMNLHALRDQLRTNEHRRNAVRDELLKLDAEHPDMDYPPEQRRHFDSLTAQAEQLRKEEVELRRKIEDRTTLDSIARTAPGITLGSALAAPEIRVFRNEQTTMPQGFDGEMLHAQDGSRVPVLEARHKLGDFVATEHRASEISFAQYLRALHSGPQNDIERRVLAEGSAGAGGAIVPAPLSAEIIDALVPKSVALRAGCRLIPMTSQSLKFARILTYPTGSWRAENSSISEDQPSFDNISLVAKSWGLLVR